MKHRSIAQLLQSRPVRMGHLTILQPLPTPEVEQISPFLLLHHLDVDVAPGTDPLGIGPHPHRGFEPVTFVFDGAVAHRDSRGHEGTVGPGGVQWMTAGMGIVHSEGATKTFIEEGGRFQMIQLWINLPKALKMAQPRYQNLPAEGIPVVETDGARVRVVAGHFGGHTGPAETPHPVTALHVQLSATGQVDVPLPAGHNALAYVLDGAVRVNAQPVGGGTLVDFAPDGDGFTLHGDVPANVLVLSGAPIDEPVVQHGPFVMNTTTEILQAMRDYQMGKMGILTDY